MDIELAISGITASNCYDKLSQAVRALAKQCGLPAEVDCMKRTNPMGKNRAYPAVILSIGTITHANRKSKFTAAVKALAKALDVPVEFVHKHHGEPYLYAIQQQLSEAWSNFYGKLLNNIYTVITASLGLPPASTESLRKALDDELFRYLKKISYTPETGEPLKQTDLDSLLHAVEQFLNQKTKETGKRMVLDAVTLGKALKRLAQYQTTRAMGSLSLEDLEYRGKPFDWIREDLQHIQEAFRIDGREMSRSELARYQVAMDHAAEKVTSVNTDVRDAIKDVVLNGIVEKRSKSQVSQDLFNCLGSENRNWKRIADTEVKNTENLAGILETARLKPAGNPLYLERYELAGCCERCAAVDGKVVLWSDKPLSNEKIEDPYTDTAIWDGKEWEKGKTVLVPGTLHPHCRGGWTPWGAQEADATKATIQDKQAVRDGVKADKGAAWDAAVQQARAEYHAQGIENPTDQTPGYTERILHRYFGAEPLVSVTVEPENAVPQQTAELSPNRKNTEAVRLSFEQVRNEWEGRKDAGGKAYYGRLRELYRKNCADFGIEPDPDFWTDAKAY